MLLHLISIYKPKKILYNQVISNYYYIHRLDYDVGGTMLITKCEKCRQEAQELIKERNVIKIYKCTVYKNTNFVYKEILHYCWYNKITKILKLSKNKTSKHNRMALMYIHTIKNYLINNIEYSEVLVMLITGRTNQIRAQMKYIGYPIINDIKYFLLDPKKETEIEQEENKNKSIFLNSIMYGLKKNNKYICFISKKS